MENLNPAETQDSPQPTVPTCRCATQIANLQARLAALELYVGRGYLAPDLPKEELLQIQNQGSQARAEAARLFAKAA
jgi:hypothetical protein